MPLKNSWSRLETPSHPGQVPTRIGRYRILGVLGVGGMGIVYRAVQDKPHRVVALKLMRPGLLSPRLLRRFEYEAEVLGRLQHEGIARIYEAGLDLQTGQPFFAMELVEGLRLDEHAQRHDADVAQRLQLLVKIAEAVHYAHQKGVVHRDLKPANILITRDGQPKILDFGVARLTDTHTATTTLQTDPGQMVGTLAYMAPEQVTGRTNEVDTRSDVYALGVLAYELLSGKPPHDLRDVPLPEAVRMVMEGEPSRLSSYDRTFRGDLETIVGKALAKEKERRYPSAAEMAQDVVHYLKYEPIEARPASSWYYLSKFAKRNKVLVSAVMVALVLLLAGLLGTTYGLIHAERQRRQAVEERRIAELTRDYLHDAMHAVDPVHSRLGRPATPLELMRHAASDLEKDERFKDHPLQKADLENHLGIFLQTLGQPEDAERLFRKAYETRKAKLGEDHFETLSALNNLAGTIVELGEPKEAERLYRDVESGFEQLYGPNHFLIWTTKLNIAAAMLEQDRPQEAEPLLREAMAGREKQFGPNAEATLRAGIELARALVEQDRPEEAEPLLRAAIREFSRPGAPPNQYLLRAKMDLGNVLQARGEYQDVERWFRAAYEGYKKLYGPDHVDTLNAATNLGTWLYQHLRRPADAEPLLRHATDGYERTLGPDHPKTLRAAFGLGVALDEMGRSSASEQILRRVLAARERVLGPTHVDTLNTIEELANTLKSLRRFDDAHQYYQRAIAGFERRLGVDHPTTLGARSNMVGALERSGRLEEAEPLQRQVLAGLEASSGPTHPGTLIAAHNLADIVEQLGRVDEAEALYRRAAMGARERLGAKNPLTIQFAGRWARSLDRLGRPAEAESVMTEFAVPPAPATRPVTQPATSTRPSATAGRSGR